jgi:hypothetical protein
MTRDGSSLSCPNWATAVSTTAQTEARTTSSSRTPSHHSSRNSYRLNGPAPSCSLP